MRSVIDRMEETTNRQTSIAAFSMDAAENELNDMLDRRLLPECYRRPEGALVGPGRKAPQMAAR